MYSTTDGLTLANNVLYNKFPLQQQVPSTATGALYNKRCPLQQQGLYNNKCPLKQQVDHFLYTQVSFSTTGARYCYTVCAPYYTGALYYNRCTLLEQGTLYNKKVV
jgi:hypothetical protein